MNLFPHQQKAVDLFLQQGRLRLLFPTGTGKTLAFKESVLAMCQQEGIQPIGTVICPAVLVPMWEEELQGYFFRVYSYEYIYRHPEKILGYFLILDEDHKICNAKSKIGRVIDNRVNSCNAAIYRISGTGTHEPRDYTDYYRPLRVLYGDRFTDKNYFSWSKRWGRFNKFTHKFQISEAQKSKLIKDLSGYQYAVDKSVIDLDPIAYEHILLDMPEKQKEVYVNLDLTTKEHIETIEAVKIGYRRQVCSDNYAGHNWTGKIEAIRGLLTDVVEDRPVIIWGTYREELEKLEEGLRDLGRTALWYGGSKKDVKAWDNGEIDLLFANPGAVGVGLNLQRCHVAIYASLDYNVINWGQSRDRIYRYGQKEQVIIYILQYKKTIEQKVAKVLARKEGVMQDVINEILRNDCDSQQLGN